MTINMKKNYTESQFQELMTEDEIHDFGIEIVFNYMKEEGFEILAVKTDRSINPQILASKDGQLTHVAVRTACYPEKGAIESEEMASQLIRYADDKNATCYFASVGIANAGGTNDEEMALPVKGAGFAVAFEGLQILTLSNRVRLMGDM